MMRGFALEIFKRRGGHSLGRCTGWKVCIMLLLILSVVAGVSVVGSMSKPMRKTGYLTLAPAHPKHAEFNYAEGEIIVKFRKSAKVYGIKSLLAANSVSSEKLFETKTGSVYKIKLRDMSVEEALEVYRSHPLVEYAEPNYVYRITETPSYSFIAGIIPNDANFSSQWHLDRINATEAWEIERGNHSVIIAIIDTGVDYTHEDLAENIWNNTDEIPGNNIDDDNNGYIDDVRGWDFVDLSGSDYLGNCSSDEDCTEEDNDPSDAHGHGTHCAGIAAAVTNNSKGVAGVCWNCKIMPLRAGWKTSSGLGALLAEDIVEAIYYAANNNATIISMSFGDYSSSQAIKDAIDYAYSKGVVLVAAAGNENTSELCYPAAYENVIAVAATNRSDNKANFSNYGYWIDVAAPGVEILSTFPGNDYAWASGTSMATPLVAGVIGLLLSKNSNLTQEQVYTAIRSSVDFLNESEYVGTGRVNAFKLLSRNSTAIARLDKSLRNSVLTGTVAINGTANASNLNNYSLYYGAGIYPNTLNLIYTGSRNVSNSTLAMWNTKNIIEGNFTLRLVVAEEGEESVDEALVEIRNARIISPRQNSIFGSVDEIVINATMATRNFTNFTLYYCNSTGCSVINTSTTPVRNATIGVWNVTALSGNYTLKLEANYAEGIRATDSVSVTIIKNITDYAIYDVDNDGAQETIVITKNETGSALSLFTNLSLVQGYPVGTEGSAGMLSLADLDADNVLELIVAANKENASLLIFNFSSGRFRNLTFENESNVTCVGVADLNRDNRVELVAFTYPSNTTWVINSTLNVTHNATVNGSMPSGNCFALADVDGVAVSYEGKTIHPKEIILTTRNSTHAYLYVFAHNLTKLFSHTFAAAENQTLSIASPVAADVDRNGEREIFLFLLNETANETDVLNRTLEYYILDWNGSAFVLTHNASFRNYKYLSQPSVGDVDSDDEPEIISLLLYQNLSQPSANKTIYLRVMSVNGTIEREAPLVNCSACRATQAVIADLLPQEGLEMAFAIENGTHAMFYVVNSTCGANLSEPLQGSVVAPPFVGNVDSDNLTEVVIATDVKFYVFEFANSFAKRNVAWQRFRFVTNDNNYRNPLLLPLYETFNGRTTRFEFLDNLSGVVNLTLEKENYGTITFVNQIINVTSLDLDSYVNISHNFIGINATALPELNRSAVLTLYNLSFVYPVIQLINESNLSDVRDCPREICSGRSYSNGTLIFNVSHFSYFAAREANARLVVWDESDFATMSVNRTVKFYANYTNFTSGEVINGSEVYCTWSENSTGDFSQPVNMIFNATSKLYEFNATFSNELNATFKVVCNGSFLGYDVIEVTDGFTVNNTPPSIVLLHPEANAKLRTRTVTLNYSASDANNDSITYFVYINNILNRSVTENFTTVTFSSDGTYNWSVVASDGFANTSSEIRNFTIDSVAPEILSVNLSKRLVINGSNVSIFVSVIDAHPDEIIANITLPNSTVVPLALTNNVWKNFTTTIEGRYNVTVIAKDTFDNYNFNETYFIASHPVAMNLSFHGRETSIEANVTFYYGNEKIEASATHNGNFSAVLPSYVYDVEVSGFNSKFIIFLRGVNVSSTPTASFSLDKISEHEGYIVIYAVNTSISFENATLNISYAGEDYTNENYLGVYRCSDWDFSSRSCNSQWQKISDSDTVQDKNNHAFSVFTTAFSAYAVKQEPYCGDGVCNGDETCSTCPEDCGACPAESSNGGVTTSTTTTSTSTTSTVPTSTTSTSTTVTTTTTPLTNVTEVSPTTTIPAEETTTTIKIAEPEQGFDVIGAVIYIGIAAILAGIGIGVYKYFEKKKLEEEMFFKRIQIQKDIDTIEDECTALRLRGINTGKIEKELQLAKRALEMNSFDLAEMHVERAVTLLGKYKRYY